jgi:hypothetical protein
MTAPPYGALWRDREGACRGYTYVPATAAYGVTNALQDVVWRGIRAGGLSGKSLDTVWENMPSVYDRIRPRHDRTRRPFGNRNSETFGENECDVEGFVL